MRIAIIAATLALALGSGSCSLAEDTPTVATPGSATADGQTPTADPSPTGESDPGGCTVATATDLADGEAAEIEIEDFAYHPSCVRIRLGQSVRIDNKDEFTHTFTADEDGIVATVEPDGGIVVKSRGAGPTLGPGANPFHCDIHPAMTGTIFVST
jgi:plastocyanin